MTRKFILKIINFKMNRRNSMFCFFISFLFPILFCFLHYKSINKMKKISINTLNNISLLPDNPIYPYYIDKIEKDSKYLFIDGWIAKKGEDNIHINRVIVVKDKNNNYYELFTKSVIRNEVTANFNNTFDYNRTGLTSRGRINKNIQYPLKIYFLIKDENKLIDTNISIE